MGSWVRVRLGGQWGHKGNSGKSCPHLFSWKNHHGHICGCTRSLAPKGALHQVTVPELSDHPARGQSSSPLLLCSGCATFGVYCIPLVYLTKQTEEYFYSLCWVGILIFFSTSPAHVEGPQPGPAGWNVSVVCPQHQCKAHLHERTWCNHPASFNFALKDGFETSHFGVSSCFRITCFRRVSLSNRWMVNEIEHKAV